MNNKIKPYRETAVALRYTGEGAPRVTAKGRGLTAEQIKKIAKENDVPLYEDDDLARLLATIDLGESIPETLYVAVAQVLAFVYSISGKTPMRKNSE